MLFTIVLAVVRWCVGKCRSAGEGGLLASAESAQDITRSSSVESVAVISPQGSTASLSSEEIERAEDDVPTETEEMANKGPCKSPPAPSWGPASPAKLPTPVRPATIFCEAGSHGQVYGAGFMPLSMFFTMFFAQFQVAALPSGTVWGDVIGYSLTKRENAAGYAYYQLDPVSHFWVDDAKDTLCTYEDIMQAIKEADDFF